MIPLNPSIHSPVKDESRDEDLDITTLDPVEDGMEEDETDEDSEEIEDAEDAENAELAQIAQNLGFYHVARKLRGEVEEDEEDEGDEGEDDDDFRQTLCPSSRGAGAVFRTLSGMGYSFE